MFTVTCPAFEESQTPFQGSCGQTVQYDTLIRASLLSLLSICVMNASTTEFCLWGILMSSSCHAMDEVGMHEWINQVRESLTRTCSGLLFVVVALMCLTSTWLPVSKNAWDFMHAICKFIPWGLHR